MEPAEKLAADVTAKCPDHDRVEVSATVQRRNRTRKGKLRLLTLDALDARTAAATAAHQLIATLSSDLGGEDQLSAGEKQLVQRAAMTGAVASDFETRWISGEEVPLIDYLQTVAVQRRVLMALGLQRRARIVGGVAVFEPDPLRDQLRKAKDIAYEP